MKKINLTVTDVDPFYGQHAFDSNPYQEHQSQWTLQEMPGLGYKGDWSLDIWVHHN
jgi:hypothetical protein